MNTRKRSSAGVARRAFVSWSTAPITFITATPEQIVEIINEWLVSSRD